MEIVFYNTLTHREEVFTPLAEAGQSPRVRMYNCGPTVYDYAHIGNFRAFVFADVLRRFLELAYGQGQVQQVMNITDVGHMTEDQLADGGGVDKMQVAAQRLREAKKQGTLPPGAVENPDDPYQVASYYMRAFIDDAAALNLKIAGDPPQHRPRATEYIPAMQRMIARLIDNGHAYVAGDGAVYYAVESFSEYGRLSGNTLDKLRGGAGGRVRDEHQQAKRHPADFLLWKPDPSHIMKWDSPWGTGYPGWHIECSAMATEVLGQDVIDIHTGGEDNIFPHHECEIAQTCGATGQSTFARFWMHTRFLLVEGEKMSKSRGNFYTIRDLTQDKGIDPAVIRFELLKAHYRSNMNFTMKSLEDAARAVQRLRTFAADLQAKAGSAQPASVELDHPALAGFAGALADDLNVSGAIGSVFKWISEPAGEPAESLAVLRQMDSVLGVIWKDGKLPPVQASASKGDGQAAALCRELDQARAAKDYARADDLRQQLMDAGYEVRTTPQGTEAVKRLT